MNKIQNEQLKIALEVDRICRKNNIKYFISSGTLLGAIRHKGFIPWDDDLDIYMLRSDYDKFKNISFNELNDAYFYQDTSTDKFYGLPYAKIRKNNTIYRENIAKNVKAHEGIYIDIFPIDNICDNFKIAKINWKINLFLRMLLLTKSKYILDNSTFIKKVENCGLKTLSFIIPKRLIIYLINKIQLKYNKVETKHVTNYGTCYFKKIKLEKKWFIEPIEYNFENKKLFGTKYYDDFLTYFYGDYMTPPPVEKRGNRHEIIEINYNTNKK